jgi:hypothetical protein
MRHERVHTSELARQQAVDELQELIQTHYPGTTFEIGPGGDDPDGTYITAIVDLDDPDEVMDLVIDRLLSLQVEERLPVYVIPVRTPERVSAVREAEKARRMAGIPLPYPQL